MFDPVHTEPRVMKLASSMDAFTNTSQPAATQARITIIVLDTLNTAFFDQVTARREILKFLSNVDPGEPVAVVNLNKSGLHVIHDFTTDPKVLAAAVRQVEGQIGFKDKAGGDHPSENLPPAKRAKHDALGRHSPRRRELGGQPGGEGAQSSRNRDRRCIHLDRAKLFDPSDSGVDAAARESILGIPRTKVRDLGDGRNPVFRR